MRLSGKISAMSVASKAFTLWTAKDGFDYAIARLLRTSRVSWSICMKIRLIMSSELPRLVLVGEEEGGGDQATYLNCWPERT